MQVCRKDTKDHLTTVSFTFSVLSLEDAVRTQR